MCNGSTERPGITGVVSANAEYLLVRRVLPEQARQRWRIADGIRRDLDSPDIERSRVDPQMHLASPPAVGGSMLTRLPLTFTCHLNAGAVDQDDHTASTAIASADQTIFPAPRAASARPYTQASSSCDI